MLGDGEERDQGRLIGVAACEEKTLLNSIRKFYAIHVSVDEDVTFAMYVIVIS